MAPKNAEELVYPMVVAGELEIDEEGRIWRVAARHGDRWRRTARTRPCARRRAENDAGDYLQVRTMLNGRRVHATAHRLVWRHFRGPIPDGLTVNHIDGLKKRNVPSNLELATYSEQQLHALHVLGVGRVDQWGERNAMAKLTAAQVEEIRQRRGRGERLKKIATSYGVSDRTVSKIALGHRWAG
jgi:hypothetical protein